MAVIIQFGMALVGLSVFLAFLGICIAVVRADDLPLTIRLLTAIFALGVALMVTGAFHFVITGDPS